MYDIHGQRVLHIYGQKQQHDQAIIVGTREALNDLKMALEVALAKFTERYGDTVAQGCEVYTADGEGYRVVVAVAPEIVMYELRLPYPLPGLEVHGQRPEKVPTVMAEIQRDYT